MHQDRITNKCLCYKTAGKVPIAMFQLLLTMQGICVLLLEMPTLGGDFLTQTKHQIVIEIYW